MFYSRFVILCCFVLRAYASLASQYDHFAFLDPDETFKLYWFINDEDKSINFAVEVKTTGWVGFGISQGLSGSMKGADIVIGWVDSTGKGHISDRYATSNSMPLVDGKQDYELIAASQDKGITVMKFKRKLKTCDKNDNDIPLGTAKVIYAYGKTDDVKYHGTKRGARSLNLMSYVKNAPPPVNAKYFDVLIKNVSVPREKTTYWCEAFKLSSLVNLTGSRHVFEIAPVIEKKHRGLVHHIVFYSCPSTFTEANLNISAPCEHPNMPPSVRECSRRSVVFAWAIGGVNFKFPEHVGWPIGSQYDMKYFVLETHFDNPSERADFVVTSGLRFYYGMPRKYEASTLLTGHSISSMLIPPQQKNWVIQGYCSKDCTGKIARDPLGRSEIKLFASFPHAHTTSTGIWTKHVRNGTEKDEVMRDASYDFDYQQTYLLKREVTFKPGDELVTYCSYNSMNRKDAVTGGLATSDEMCLNFIMYYPRANVTGCYSDSPGMFDKFARFYARPVIQLDTVKNNGSAPTIPKQYRNWTDIKWNKTMVQQLENFDKEASDVRSVCMGEKGVILDVRMARKVVIAKSLPPPPDTCVKISGGAVTASGNLMQVILTLFSVLVFSCYDL